ncbi:gas vesicle protein [Streptomyces marispadix]
MGPSPNRAVPYGQQGSSANLADILERVLDKGVVIAGDIQINLLDIELLTIKLRLLVVSVDKAKEMGIDWWENDPSLSSRASARAQQRGPALADGNGNGIGDGNREGAAPEGRGSALAEENERLRREIERLRSAAELPADTGAVDGKQGKSAPRAAVDGGSGGDGTTKRAGRRKD